MYDKLKQCFMDIRQKTDFKPEIAVVTNREGGISRTPLKNLNSVNASVFETGKYKGIVVEFTNDKIALYGDIDKKLAYR